MAERKKYKKDEKIAKRARTACEQWRDAFRANIDRYHYMHGFVLGDQWTSDERNKMLTTFQKTALTSPKLGAMANSLLGEQQQNTPQLQVTPVSGCTEQVAELRELIVKDLILSPKSRRAHEKAGSQAAIGGYSAMGVGTDYCHAKSFDLDIEMYYFNDATRTYFDLGAQDESKTDGMYCGYYSQMSRKKFKESYGKGMLKDIIDDSGVPDDDESIGINSGLNESGMKWVNQDGVIICDHFERKYVKETLYKLSNGDVLDQEEMDELRKSSRKINKQIEQEELMMALMQEQMAQSPMMDAGAMPQDLGAPQDLGMPQEINQEVNQDLGAQPDTGFSEQSNEDMMPKDEGQDVGAPEAKSGGGEILWVEHNKVTVADERPSKKSVITHYKIAGNYVLDETEFPSEQLPIIFVDQDSYYDDAGQQICRSFFRDAVDIQIYINYLRTQSAHVLKTSRYDQWLCSKKNVSTENTQLMWRTPWAVQGALLYDESPSGAKPEQIRPPELSQSLSQQYQMAIEDLYTSTGLYPARMGNNGDEASGVAIDARTRQGGFSTYICNNALRRAIGKSGEIINEMIGRVYDTQRLVTIMTEDEGMKSYVLNQDEDEYGERVSNDIRKGTYQVRLLPGNGYEGQKREELEGLREILQASPDAFNLIADLYAKNLSMPNTIEITNRLKTLVSPDIIEAGNTGKMPQQNNQPSPEQQAMQMEMQLKMKQFDLQEKELEMKREKIQMDYQIELKKVEAAQMEAAAKIEVANMGLIGETNRDQAEKEIAHGRNLVDILTHKIE